MTRCPSFFLCGVFALWNLRWFPQNGVFIRVFFFPNPPVLYTRSVAYWSSPLLSLFTITDAGHLSPCKRENSPRHPSIFLQIFRCYYAVGLMHLSVFMGGWKCPLFVILPPQVDHHPFASRAHIDVVVDMEALFFLVSTFLYFIQ